MHIHYIVPHEKSSQIKVLSPPPTSPQVYNQGFRWKSRAGVLYRDIYALHLILQFVDILISQ